MKDWQITKAEYIKRAYNHSAMFFPDGTRKEAGVFFDSACGAQHRNIVDEAIARGEDVPVRVLETHVSLATQRKIAKTEYYQRRNIEY